MVILKVYLDSSNSRVAEVPINNNTTFADIIQCCKDPGRPNDNYRVVELWRGCERPVSDNEKPFEILKQWGIHRDEVRFYLRNEVPNSNDNLPKQNAVRYGDNSPNLPDDGGMSLHELQRMAAMQQQQIDKQQHMLVAKEQRLKFLKQQDLKQQQVSAENERLFQLREKVEAQEMKLKKLRALRGQVDQQKMMNTNLNSELESIKALFNEKEKELSLAVGKVEDMKKQLDDLRRGNQNQSPGINGNKLMELEKLKKELSIRNRLNEQQNVRLIQRRETLSKRQNDISVIDQRIQELQLRLQKKRQLQQQQSHIQVPPHKDWTVNSNVATVEPYNKQDVPSVDNASTYNKAYEKKDQADLQPTQPVIKDIYSVKPEKPVDDGSNQSQKAYLVKQPVAGRPQYTGLIAPKGWGSTSSSQINRISNNTDTRVKASIPVYSLATIDTNMTTTIPSRPSPTGSGDSTASLSIDSSLSNSRQDSSRSGPTTSTPNTSLSVDVNAPKTSSAEEKSKFRYAPKNIINNMYTKRLGSSALGDYNKALNQLYQSFPSKPLENKSLQQKQTSPTAKVQPMQFEESTDFSTADNTDVSDKNDDFPMPEFHPGGTINADKFSHKTNSLRHLRRRHSSTESDELNRVLQVRLERQEQAEKDAIDERGNSENTNSNKPAAGVIVQCKRAAPVILRKKNQARDADRSSRRVSFDPHALLLDASLEGELELVMKTAREVTDPSQPNDEGITALHNAICAGHFDIVTFLVEFGCDVNAADSDGWTPLHCAASCNNLAMVKFLVEHGACIFAMTISDQETAAEKCEEDEDGFDGCSEYLYSVQEKMGILNCGAVYGLYEYKPQNDDELRFDINDRLIVLRKVNDTERGWWWARVKDREGYIPRNLIGLYPRVIRPEEDQTSC
ncbi:apoptosis-stimulating of p53 protein 2-like isoform X2 [Tubulanus polymorphus]|uniref:apoptosis-stimulating of p53 protein 2-like isoform X2 n=1 Tax=Tubulanus polymorphus TaxID=672921 RepID=UPI003DA23B53